MKRYTALVEAQKNPFVYGRPISLEEDLADREEEKRALVADALSGQPVMMHALRRYGKTSLVRGADGLSPSLESLSNFPNDLAARAPLMHEYTLRLLAQALRAWIFREQN